MQQIACLRAQFQRDFIRTGTQLLKDFLHTNNKADLMIIVKKIIFQVYAYVLWAVTARV